MENNEDYNICRADLQILCGPLTSYLKFATVCVTTEEKIIQYCEQIDANGQGLVGVGLCTDNTPTFVHELNSKVSCMNVIYVILRQNTRGILKNIFWFIEKIPEVEMYECDTCHFKTKYKRYLKTHVLLHRENSEVKMYECDLCQYKTKHKGYLKHIFLVHRKTLKWRCILVKRTSLIHRKNSEVQMYTCETCKFMTKHKLENSEVDVYGCETCQFKAKRKDQLKNHLKIHLVVHRENIEMETYECKTCHSKTKHKSSPAIQNKDNDVKMYECEKCFKSKFKQKVKVHHQWAPRKSQILKHLFPHINK
ncbi:hypothetical protein NQ317_001840 [Molorchus minor]|uniref:Protein hunchback n=1 Tax=Molorchus minor TaxID=1323400 RepID=A0ABQ9JAI9_9CUCU|nr:hypothetical protein NQ317_001840 [Molorchus minor]